MKKFILFVAVLAVAGLAIRYWWQENYPSGSWRYKMTVEVETPEGVKTGSAVREVTVTTGIKLGPGSLPHVALKGEAIVVDLGARGLLFALLRGYKKGDDYGADIPALMFSPTEAVMKNETIRYMSGLKTPPAEVPVEMYPMFVHFKDLNDPKSVEQVLEMKWCPDPKTGIPNHTVCISSDRFEEIYGEGVRLKSVIVEMTSDPVVFDDISKCLPWLNGLDGGYLHGGITAREAPLGLHAGNFQDR